MNIHSRLVMKTGGRQSERDLRRRIDAAALHLFAERGAAATPMPMIADAACVAVGSLYRYDASKEELVARLYAENYAALARALDDAQREEVGARAKLAAMTRFICRYFDEEWDVARFLLLEQHSGLRDYADPANPIDILERVVAAGIAAGDIRPLEPIVAAALVMGPIVQAATFRAYGRLPAPMSTIADDIATTIWAAIAAKRG
jgi:AcrR family transcriptional regulator